MAGVTGRIHSFESFGAVDGPGVRFVVFLQGCLLRCLYCHNPDTWECGKGKEITSDEMMKTILCYKNFISKGGVTLSGGEPLLQAEFCEEIIDKCHESGLHTAIDTSGAVPLEKSSGAILKSDLLLLDLKEIDSDDCITLTGLDNKNFIATLNFCEKNNKDVWIRHVLLPNYTLNDIKLRKVGEFLKKYTCVKKIELLPYHTMGLYKWSELGIKSQLEGVDSPSVDDVENAKEILRSFGLVVA